MKVFAALVLVLLGLLAALQYKLWHGAGGQNDVAALNAQVEAQRAENARLQARNDALAAEVSDLKSGGEAVEERARSELGLVKPGETFYRVIDGNGAPSATPTPTSSAPPASATVTNGPAP